MNQRGIETFAFLDKRQRNESLFRSSSTYFGHFIQTDQIESFGVDGEIHRNGSLESQSG